MTATPAIPCAASRRTGTGSLIVTDIVLNGPPLVPGEAAAALLVTSDGRYLLQHRDPLPGIFFPGWWGLFGGALDPGEDPETALRRELFEELAFHPAEVRPFCILGLDFGHAGHGQADRHIFEIPIDPGDPARMTLGEGQGMKLLCAEQALHHPQVIPYDLTVIWQHASRHRF